MPPEAAPELNSTTAPAMTKQPAVPGLQPSAEVVPVVPDAPAPAEVVVPGTVMETSQASQLPVPMEVAPSEPPVVPVVPEVPATASVDATAAPLPKQPAVSAPAETEVEQDKAGELFDSMLVLLVDVALSLDDLRCILVVGCR